MWNEQYLKEGFDIIIEDGLHTFEANVCFFENSIHKLKKGGYFIIEDIIFYEKHLFEDKIKYWNEKYIDCLFKLIIIPSSVNNSYNTVLVIYKYF